MLATNNNTYWYKIPIMIYIRRYSTLSLNKIKILINKCQIFRSTYFYITAIIEYWNEEVTKQLRFQPSLTIFEIRDWLYINWRRRCLIINTISAFHLNWHVLQTSVCNMCIIHFSIKSSLKNWIGKIALLFSRFQLTFTQFWISNRF